MRLQELEYSCCAASIVNAFSCLGLTVNERHVRKIAGTKKKGTSFLSVAKTIEKFGVKIRVFSLELTRKTSTKMFKTFNKALSVGHPVIIATNNLSHCSTIVGMLGDKYVLFDPVKTRKNLKENGVHILSKDSLLNACKAKDSSTMFIVCGG